MSDRWTQFRQQMPIAQRWAYFDHAAVAPISRPAAEAIRRWTEQSLTAGDTIWPEWAARVKQIRQMAARLIAADEAEIGLLKNTTEGINLVAEGLDWRPGDNIVTLADEFPSNQYPWLNQAHRQVEVRRLPTDRGKIDLDSLAKACDARTRIVAISWVGYATGYRHPIDVVAQIAHDAGALFFLDAIQGLGVFPIDVNRDGIDFLAADGHKWMLGPEGAGVFYMRREHLDRLRPLGVGWNSVAHAHDFTTIEPRWRNSVERYEGGSQNIVGMLGLGASLDLLLELGTERVAARLLEVTDLACDRLQQTGATIVSHRTAGAATGGPRSGIVAFELPGRDPAEARGRLLDAGVVASCRGGRLRISPHAYTNEADIEQLVDGLK